MGQYNRNDPFMTFLCIKTGDNYNTTYSQDTFREGTIMLSFELTNISTHYHKM